MRSTTVTPQESGPFSTYNQAVEGLWAPELLKRFGGAQKLLRKAICALEWYEAQPRVGEIARVTLAEIEGRTLVGLLEKIEPRSNLDRFERIPEGYLGAGDINNCALANGVEEKDCQMCQERCPDRERFKAAPSLFDPLFRPATIDDDPKNKLQCSVCGAMSTPLDGCRGTGGPCVIRRPKTK